MEGVVDGVGISGMFRLMEVKASPMGLAGVSDRRCSEWGYLPLREHPPLRPSPNRDAYTVTQKPGKATQIQLRTLEEE